MRGQEVRYSVQTPSPLIARVFLVNIPNIMGTNVPCVREYHSYLNAHWLSDLRQIYTSGSSLTTRRRHLAKEHLEDYLSFIAQNNLPNKLPDALRKQRQEQRARDSQRIPFSIEVFEEQLIAVIVSNDLVSPPSFALTLLIYV
jgi:hypothetical protein